MNSIIFYDPLTSYNGGWTIPAEVQSASSYSSDGWRITSSSGYQQIKNNLLIPSENIEVSFIYNGGDAEYGYNNLIMMFYNGTTRLSVQLVYQPENRMVYISDKEASCNLNNGDKITFKYNNMQATLQVNQETILTHTYNNTTLKGTHIELHTHDNRWVQLKDFTIRQGETQ